MRNGLTIATVAFLLSLIISLTGRIVLCYFGVHC